MYGITETTVHVTYRPLRAADCELDTSPIGVPIPDLQALPARRAGAAGAARRRRGALRRRRRRRARLPEPARADCRAVHRRTRSGPGGCTAAATWRAGGPTASSSSSGRIDDQVKIRGFRIELGEVRGRDPRATPASRTRRSSRSRSRRRHAACRVRRAERTAADALQGDVLSAARGKLPALHGAGRRWRCSSASR